MGISFPHVSVERRLFVAGIVESVAISTFAAVSVLYLVRVQHLHPASVAIAMSVGGVAGLILPLPIGALADRVGVRRVALWVFTAEALTLLLYAGARSSTVAVVAVAATMAAQRSSSSVRSALVARTFGREHRVRIQSHLRSAMFIGAAVGSGLAFIVIRVDAAYLYRVALAACAGLCLIAALLICAVPVPSRTDDGHVSVRGSIWIALKDHRYLAVAGASSLVGLHDSLLEVALPLIVVITPGVSELVIPIVILLEAILTIALQQRIGARVKSIADAVRCHILAVFFLLPATALLAFAATSEGTAASALLVLGGIIVIYAAIFHAAGAIGLGYDLADEHYIGAYLGAFSLGRSLQLSAGPVLVTATVATGGLVGALGFGTILVLAPLLVRKSVARVVEQRGLSGQGVANTPAGDPF